ncbi:unnamed protein product [Lepeophtheirus salmonis]|uniref:(salmon louse) hypothetical protein n=1 Tax=Lepeophtheirus salmonis TaxID=72036 RepID=A0A7R8CP72_LEPSM|nr:unnamed protein product [Lepeophtheirus salmonis]CAF2883339.1 unnamed protein product [Lepeophtheirus salmonis]
MLPKFMIFHGYKNPCKYTTNQSFKFELSVLKHVKSFTKPNTLFPYNETVERRFQLIDSLEKKVPLYSNRIWCTKPSELEYLFFQEKDRQEKKIPALKRKGQPCTFGLSVPLLDINPKKLKPSQSLSMPEEENQYEYTMDKKYIEGVSFQLSPEECIVHEQHFINTSLIQTALTSSSNPIIDQKIGMNEQGIKTHSSEIPWKLSERSCIGNTG